MHEARGGCDRSAASACDGPAAASACAIGPRPIAYRCLPAACPIPLPLSIPLPTSYKGNTIGLRPPVHGSASAWVRACWYARLFRGRRSVPLARSSGRWCVCFCFLRLYVYISLYLYSCWRNPPRVGLTMPLPPPFPSPSPPPPHTSVSAEGCDRVASFGPAAYWMASFAPAADRVASFQSAAMPTAPPHLPPPLDENPRRCSTTSSEPTSTQHENTHFNESLRARASTTRTSCHAKTTHASTTCSPAMPAPVSARSSLPPSGSRDFGAGTDGGSGGGGVVVWGGGVRLLGGWRRAGSCDAAIGRVGNEA